MWLSMYERTHRLKISCSGVGGPLPWLLSIRKKERFKVFIVESSPRIKLFTISNWLGAGEGWNQNKCHTSYWADFQPIPWDLRQTQLIEFRCNMGKKDGLFDVFKEGQDYWLLQCSQKPGSASLVCFGHDCTIILPFYKLCSHGNKKEPESTLVVKIGNSMSLHSEMPISLAKLIKTSRDWANQFASPV